MITTITHDELMDELEDFDPDKSSNADKLRAGQNALLFAIGIFDEVAKATGDGHAKAYMVDQLTTLATSDHEFLSRDFNVDEWISQIENL